MENEIDLRSIADFFFEAGMLAKTPRTGFFFLGSGAQSVAEHTNRATYIAFALAKLEKDVDLGKILTMCMFHDFTETRISDLNHVHQIYTERHEHEAMKDLTDPLPFGKDIASIAEEYEERESKESKIVKDADTLEFLLALKEQTDIGNARAKAWIPSVLKRLHTETGKKLAETIVTTDSDRWWFNKRSRE